MTENEIRFALSAEINDAVVKAKASAMRMMQRVIAQAMIEMDAENEDEEYARTFDEIAKVVRAYILEMQSTAIG